MKHALGAYFVIPLGRAWDLTLDYDYIDSGSNVPALDYTKNVLTLRIQVAR